MPKVVIAYEGFTDIQIEQEVLNGVSAEVIHTRNLTNPEALEAVKTADALMVTIQQVTAKIIASMSNCKIISRVGTGLDAIDIPAATRHGVWVTNVPDYSIDEVSAHAITLLLVHARGLMRMLESVKAGKWWDPVYITGVQRLQGQTLGVVAYGRIGQATAKKALGLGLNVIVYDPYQKQEVIEADGVKPVDLDTLLATSDYISLHAPLTDSTRHLINAASLAKVKPTCFLINTARGPLVDEEALVQAVRSGKLAGAAIDVLDVEPPLLDHPFLHEPRIMVTPHAAWYSEEAKLEVRRKGAEEVARVLRGERPRIPVNQING